MNKVALIILTATISINLSFSQTESDINSLLNAIAVTKNSKGIIKTEQAIKLIDFGEKTLINLAEFFTESTLTKVKSECQERNLTKGEIAIIIADHIQNMPYALLTGIQNCLFTFCKDNPNWIEYYLWAIKRDGVEKFKEKYIDWLSWTKLSDKEKIKIERINKRKFKKQQREIRKIVQQTE
jgi:hypothetical protein